MALAQQQTTSSSFFNNMMRSPSYFSFPSIQEESTNIYPFRGTTYFDRDNQKPESEYIPIISFWFSPISSQDKLIELKEYKGFNFMEKGEIAVSYNKDNFDLINYFKFICLNKQEHNDYYPDPYLFICFELELEGSGKSKEDALNNLYQLLDVYFNRIREICENPEEYENIINDNIYQQNLWKQSFARTYNRAQKLGLINADYQYQIT
ncbi:MAG: hypothetical protein LBC76_03110 [Treponema sp.]|jgi:hypothetical protein|nr:hypothetical protein [Treponema sp.]